MSASWSQVLLRHRAGLQMTADVTAWIVALVLATALRFDFDPALVLLWELPTAAVIVGTGQVVLGLLSGLYLGRRRYGSFEELTLLSGVVAVTTAVLLLANVPYGASLIPRSAALGGGVGAFVIMGGIRYAWRLLLERRRRPHADTAERVIVFGAGEGAVQVLTAMLQDPRSPYLPVALLDDDPTKRYLSIKGVRVAGSRDRLEEAAKRYAADTLLVAVPSADRALIHELNERGRGAGLRVRIVPSVSELLGGDVSLRDIREVTEADLLGRGQVDTDLAAIAGYLAGRRVLVTGAGGSIGSELCRQIVQFSPAELVLVDRDESALHALQLTLHGRASLDAEEIILLDIRDRDRVHEVFAERQPHVVFHAAALKHVTALESHPQEAVKTNVEGTLHLLDAAAAVGVERFVNISTDKAANPRNVLGYTKRIAERLTADAGTRSSGTFLSVRFGNVLGSRGSMLTVFRRQLDRGQPITVTDPEATRYFMTVQEACQLVIQAGAIGTSGEALVLDMGEPVRIAEVASRLAREVDPPAHIVYTGLRPGEKLHEELLGAGEDDRRPVHPLISHVTVPPLNSRWVHELRSVPGQDVTDVLARLSAVGDEGRHSAAAVGD